MNAAVNCGTPDPPDPNGSKKVTNTVLNGKVIYYCNKGFNLVGHPIAVCKTNGQWSSKAPTCKRKNTKTMKYENENESDIENHTKDHLCNVPLSRKQQQ